MKDSLVSRINSYSFSADDNRSNIFYLDRIKGHSGSGLLSQQHHNTNTGKITASPQKHISVDLPAAAKWPVCYQQAKPESIKK